MRFCLRSKVVALSILRPTLYSVRIQIALLPDPKHRRRQRTEALVTITNRTPRRETRIHSTILAARCCAVTPGKASRH